MANKMLQIGKCHTESPIPFREQTGFRDNQADIHLLFI